MAAKKELTQHKHPHKYIFWRNQLKIVEEPSKIFKVKNENRMYIKTN